uniref:OBG-type G domain-containing protein n=1 Tax=Zooxanthella nutricula TaxID=1333877 RepID=A0A7S2VLN5_9DINO
MASFSKTSSKAGSGVGGGGWAKAKHSTGGGGTILEKIANIELEMARTQKNKATATHLGSLKAKLCQLRRQLLEPDSKAGGGKQPGFEVQKMGDARVGLVGFPSVGKSSLLTALTGVESEAAAYEFTTLTCIPGVIHYNDVRIQLLDLPGIIVGAASGRGRGRQVIATAKSCDIILMVLDPTKEDTQKDLLTKELEAIGIRLNRRPPDVTVTKCKGGGLKFNATTPLTHLDKDVCQSVLNQYKIYNADVIVREDCTVDELIDVLEGNRKYCKCLYVYNKIDMLSIHQVEELARQPYSVVISVNKNLNMDGLLERVWQELDLKRVYTKKKGMFPDFTDPMVMTAQRGDKTATVENAVGMLHKSLLDDFKAAMVWGASVRSSPQVCGLKHELVDEDVMQIIKMTPAEKARRAHGKKTGTTLAGTGMVDPKAATRERAPLKT